MKNIIIKESSLEKIISLMKENTDDGDYEEYEDDTSYSSYEYKDEIENYLNSIASSFGNISCYVEEENDKFYLDFLDFKICFDLDMDNGILYINNISMYDRTDAKSAYNMDNILINVLTKIKDNPLNVSQQLQ